MPHIPTKFMSTAPRAELSPTSKPTVPYLGGGKGETNSATRKSKAKSTLLSRLSPFKYEVDPERVLNMMQQVSGLIKRKYSVDDHTRGLVRNDNASV
jgi:hypothetical protein